MMFYHTRLEGWVHFILRHGLHITTDDAVGMWPKGDTAKWVKLGKSKSWKPVEAAMMAVSQTALETVEAGRMGMIEGLAIAHKAVEVGRVHNARSEFLEHLFLLINHAIPDAAEKGASR